MKNVTMKVEGSKLFIEVDLSKEYGESSTGKSIIISTTEGNQDVPNVDDVKIGLNIYKKVVAKPAKKSKSA
jgi:hypothetical protein